MTLSPTQLMASQEDINAVRDAALDYIEGYVQGDAERHALAYHPECIKRQFATDEATGIEQLVVLSPQVMADYAAKFGGATEDAEWEVIIDDVSAGMASVRVYSTQWVDFLHVVKARGEWRLLHVTWHDRRSVD